MRRASIITVAAVMLAGSVVLSGCGGGSGKPSAKAPPAKPALTRPQFVSRANAVCRRAKLRATRLERPTDLVSYARVARSLVRIASRARDDVADLEPPAADRGIVDAYLAALDSPIRELRRVRTAAYKEDHAEVERRVRRFRLASRRADRLADGFGMAACGTGR